MDFTPHSEGDLARMLSVLGLASESELFAHLPDGVALAAPDPGLPPPMSEPELMAHVDTLAARNSSRLICFAGGGFYDHHLPPVVRALSSRPEFVTSYTPYQSEAAQGVLQALWEYQSLISTITGLPVANASLYDGATAGLEAVNLALAETGRESVWVSRGVHPRTRQVIATFARVRDFELHELPLLDGRTVWEAGTGPPPAAVLFSQPNHLGVIEDYSAAVQTAHLAGALAVAEVDPMLLGVLRRPGDAGCDLAVGEGQPLGSPLSFGGPALGLFAASRPLMRRVPGRLVGRTIDSSGRTGYTLTLRTREQDIRREKASSNICTNQTLIAIAAAVHLAWLGPEGLASVGRQSVARAHHLAHRLSAIPGVRLGVGSRFAREFPILLPADPEVVIDRMAERGFLAGIPIGGDLPEFPGGLLVAVTEKRTREQLDGYAQALEEVLADA
ncbi:MAG: aminomethyl-transferring glycine dehydrogenase subunit GcvPA [Acidimicrobiia bacterium]|nr:MAG: aminomethyl-transferring glycine dehydrogenase subunit GcvPA [Acidimicrobiia bacterium]